MDRKELVDGIVRRVLGLPRGAEVSERHLREAVEALDRRVRALEAGYGGVLEAWRGIFEGEGGTR